MANKLYRSEDNRVIGGVCAGLAKHFDVDVVLVRLVFVALGFVNGLGVLAYLILWLVVPDEGRSEMTGEDVLRANLDDIRQRARQVGESLRNSGRSNMIIGGLLVLIGASLLLKTFVPAISAGLIWPIALIGLGVYLLVTHL